MCRLWFGIRPLQMYQLMIDEKRRLNTTLLPSFFWCSIMFDLQIKVFVWSVTQFSGEIWYLPWRQIVFWTSFSIGSTWLRHLYLLQNLTDAYIIFCGQIKRTWPISSQQKSRIFEITVCLVGWVFPQASLFCCCKAEPVVIMSKVTISSKKTPSVHTRIFNHDTLKQRRSPSISMSAWGGRWVTQ